MISIFFGLLAALSWGAGDFFGGLSSRRVGAYLAVFLSEIIGLIFLVALIPVVREPLPAFDSLLASLAAGSIGGFSLMLLYQAMTSGSMSIAAPVSALLAAAVPIVVGSFTEGLPRMIQIAGFGLALAAVWLISQGDSGGKPRLTRLADLFLPLLSGLGFGMYFVLMHQGSQHLTLMPMIIARCGGAVVLLIYILVRREPLRARHRAWGFIVLNTLLDVGGNLFYILAGQNGRMDVAAVLSALYPGGTVFLAWMFLKERINRSQTAGILAALAAIALMTI